MKSFLEPIITELDVKDEFDKVIDDKTANDSQESKEDTSDPSKRMTPVWSKVIIIAYIHIGAFYGVYLMFTSAMWQTTVFGFFMYIVGMLGITAGAHRLWAHRTYKAKLPLKLLLALFFTIAFQEDLFIWIRNHKMHHKYSDTNADPHNAKRGFFFAQIGWYLCYKHPEHHEKRKQIDFSDLLADPFVYYNRKYYWPLSVIFSIVLPTIIPMFFWGETFNNAYYIGAIFKFCMVINNTGLINSAAHLWGQRPYDVSIQPTQNLLVSLGAVGEGFHNYHHTFPYDYAASEFGMKYNLATAFIDTMAYLGLAYDRRTVPKSLIEARKLRTGSASHDKNN